MGGPAGSSQVDILGLSWGGALAQQFAFQNPRRCRRLILVSTGTGSIMIPGKPAVLAKMPTPRRFLDHRHAARVAPELYGGTARHDPLMIKRVFDRQLMAGSTGRLPSPVDGRSRLDKRLRVAPHPAATLIIAGTDDPIIALANAKIMSRLLPNATLHVHAGGHVEIVTSAADQARVIEAFRRRD